MKVVESKAKNILFAKKSAEFRLGKLREAIEVYSKAIKAYDECLESEKSEASKSVMMAKQIELKEKFGQFVTEYNETLQYYENEISPKVSKIYDNMSEEPLDADKLLDLEKEANEMAEIELFGDVKYEPENIEHTKVINSIKELIQINKNIVTYAEKEETTDGLEKAMLDIEIFKAKLQIMSLEKRLAERLEYHDQFMKVYVEDMKDCDANFDNYMERAKALTGINPMLTGLIMEYDKHKDDDEKLWLFFTTLKAKVNETITQMLADPKTFDPYKTSHLTAKIS